MTFNSRPELFDNILLSTKEKTDQVLNDFSNSVLNYFDSPIKAPTEELIIDSIPLNVIPDNNKEIVHPDYLLKSQSLIASILNTFNLTHDNDLGLLSISSGTMNLEFIGAKTHTVPVDSIGNVLNYSLRQIAGEDKYKHGFLINYPKINTENKTFSNISVDSLESFVNNLDDSTIKTLTQTQSEIDRKIPVIVRILDLDNIKLILEYLSIYSNNSSLDKFVYKKFNDGTNESAIYYIAVHDQVDSSTKN